MLKLLPLLLLTRVAWAQVPAPANAQPSPQAQTSTPPTEQTPPTLQAPPTLAPPTEQMPPTEPAPPTLAPPTEQMPVPPALTQPQLVASPSKQELLARGHHKKVVGAVLMIVGSLLDATTTALTFTGLARGGWSITPKDSTDTALLWTGVGAGFAVDTILTAGIVVYCNGGVMMHKALYEK